jgi:hypothetical protein
LKLGALMDVAMNLLGGGLQVGVDARQEGVFLLQMGIYCTAKPESLDFMLELCLYPAPNQQVQRRLAAQGMPKVHQMNMITLM